MARAKKSDLTKAEVIIDKAWFEWRERKDALFVELENDRAELQKKEELYRALIDLVDGLDEAFYLVGGERMCIKLNPEIFGGF